MNICVSAWMTRCSSFSLYIDHRQGYNSITNLIKMLRKVPFSSLLSLFFLGLLLYVALHVEAFSEDVPPGVRPYLVKRGFRRSLVVTEYGEISTAEISTGAEGPYHIQFITLEPNSLFLPVLLHADMVFYVNTGNGKLSWTDGGKEMKRMNLRRGDVYRLQAGSAFFVQSNLDSERQKMRIHAIFSNTDEDIYDPSIGAYSSINDLILGFDRKILKAAFKVPEEVLEEITSATKPPPVVHAVTKDQKSALWELEDRLVNILIGGRDDPLYEISNKHKKTKETETFNILDADPDFENCNGWSLTVDKWSLKSVLMDSNIGIFMVNLTKGSMMGPHWNPTATEIAVVLHGQGMVRLVCPSTENESECKNMRFKVKEGDVFAVPRFHPMAQMSFNNDSFVFMGFSTSTKRNHPQFLTGKSSILRMVDRGILAVSFNVTNTSMDQLLNSQEDALILDCTSCAEEEEDKMKKEIEKEKEKQEEEARKREEERRREEEREKKREEEEARKKEERKREEDARKREEEEARKREEEEAKKREEEARKREEEEREREEEAKKREEEEREREEEEARTREEEKKRKREQEEAERERERQEEEEKQRQEAEEQEEEEEREREEEEAKKTEEEKRRKEEEKRREQEEAERERERQEEEEKQRQEEEVGRKEHEESRIQEEKRQKRRRKEEEKAKERERHEGDREQPKEQEVEARKEDQERKGDEGKGRRALRKGWKL